MADIETLAATKRTHAEGAAPATPSAAEVVIYAKSDGLMYSKDDAGTETLMSSGTSLSNPMTTAEDIIKGGVSGATSRMALGASNTVLASSNSTLAYVPLGTKAFAPDSLGASSAPTAANDFTQGWRRGSRWIDTVTDKEYVCLDETTGAAVWTETTQSGSATSSVGWQPVAWPMNMDHTAAFTTALDLPANGGAISMPICLWARMLLQDVTIRQRSTTGDRSWEWRLYLQDTNSGDAGENTLAEVAGANGSDSFTASAVISRISVATSAPVSLDPGAYFLVIRNTHATNTLQLAITEQSAEWLQPHCRTKTLGSALGSTLDFVAATWATSTAIVAARVRARVFGQTSSY